jgi:hypothetical protein
MSEHTMVDGPKKAKGLTIARKGTVQRKCNKCGIRDEEKKTGALRRSAVAERMEKKPLILSVPSRSNGLLSGARQQVFPESRFRHDFSTVRARSGTEATEPARRDAPVRIDGSETVHTRNRVMAGNGRMIDVETKIERPGVPSRPAMLSDSGEMAADEGESSRIVKVARAVRSEGGETYCSQATAATPAAAPCTYAITYANISTPGCGGGLCGAQIMYDVTRVTTSGSSCPSLAGLRLTESVTTDNGCGPGNVQTGGGCSIGAGGTVAAGCTDTYGLCGPAASFPAAGCTERYSQNLYVGGVLAERRTITFRIDRTGGGCSGTVNRT